MSDRRVVPDDHRASIEHFLAALGAPLRTVVHVGAHAGEEVEAYRRHGAERIVLIEAAPANHARLAERYADAGDVHVVHAAVTDRNGTERLLLHTNRRGETESASLLPMKRLGEIVPTLQTEDAVEVPATTLDALLEREAIDAGAVGLLVLDVQGAELRVLHGAEQALASVGAVLTEVALIELYEGAGREEDIEPLLLEAGFEARESLYYELYEGERRFPAWGDRLFARARGG
jgi:FkbM family methyltransferase